MNALLNKAIEAITRLPESEQEAIARDVLDLIDADARWNSLLADPRSPPALARLVREARDDIAAGAVHDVDPSNRRSS